MNAQKIREVLNIYRKKFEELGIPKGNWGHGTLLPNPHFGLIHCHGMLTKVEGFLKEGRLDKAFRWLGFVQGALWVSKVYTLNDLKNHNRPSK